MYFTKNIKISLIAFVLLFCTLTCFTANAYKCTLKGVIIDRDSKQLFLQKVSDSKAREPERLVIPIRDHHFEFSFDVNETEAYELIFDDEWNVGAYNPVIFFPSAIVDFKLYPQAQFAKNEVNGGNLNSALLAYKTNLAALFNKRQAAISATIDSLYKAGDYRSHAPDSIMALIKGKNHADINPGVWKRLDEMEKTGEGYTAHGNRVRKEQSALTADKIKMEYAYINDHPTMVSYYLMLADVLYVPKDNEALLAYIKSAYPKYAAKYPTHSYTKKINNILTGFNKINPGEPFIDVTLPGLDGKQHRLSDLAKGKYTLIDFWGSWCGPCIAASRTMVPVYNDFKNKGFNIVGIAKEYKNTNGLKIALKREKYAWLNLVELNDKNNIWNKYGINNSTGMMLLLGPDGKIIAVDPTAEVVRKTLAANL